MNNRFLLMIIFLNFFSLNAINPMQNDISLNLSFFNKIKKETQLKKEEKLVIYFYNQGDCGKCFLLQKMKVDCALRELGVKALIKQLALVAVDRVAELIYFRKDFNWHYNLLIDDGKAKKNLNLQFNTSLAVFDYNGKLLISFTFEQTDIYNECKILAKVLK